MKPFTDLNRRVAIALGWKCKEIETALRETWAWYEPDGKLAFYNTYWNGPNWENNLNAWQKDIWPVHETIMYNVSNKYISFDQEQYDSHMLILRNSMNSKEAAKKLCEAFLKMHKEYGNVR